MKKVISIGIQGFSDLREQDCFFVDKTNFIKEWWENRDVVTLITRPRRFGKTLNMSMLDCFFSNKYANRADLFEGLSIWQDEAYRKLQGTYPVIFLSFAAVKAGNLEDAKTQIKQEIARLYEENRYLLEGNVLSDNERKIYNSTTIQMDDTMAQNALKTLSVWMERYYGKKVIILLDEYDTPMQEAYVQGYWDEFTSFVRSLFNASFKTNPYLERAIMTGITRVSKESIFSDLNNLCVVTTTSNLYADCFGFTEEEVFAALDEFGYGRYDVMFTPVTEVDDAIVIEFKVHAPDEEENLKDTVRGALEQIAEKNYDAELLAQGIPADRIRHYGFAFEGKKF